MAKVTMTQQVKDLTHKNAVLHMLIGKIAGAWAALRPDLTGSAALAIEEAIHEAMEAAPGAGADPMQEELARCQAKLSELQAKEEQRALLLEPEGGG